MITSAVNGTKKRLSENNRGTKNDSVTVGGEGHREGREWRLLVS